MNGIAYASYDAVNSHALVEIRHVVAGVREAMKVVLFRCVGCDQAALTTVKITGAAFSETEIYANKSAPDSIDLLHLSVT